MFVFCNRLFYKNLAEKYGNLYYFRTKIPRIFVFVNTNTIMKHKSLISLLLVVAFASCKKDDNELIVPDEPKEQYNCIFDSKISDFKNVTNPTFIIFVDSVQVGVWPGNLIDNFHIAMEANYTLYNNSYLGMEPNYEGLTDTKVHLNLAPGEHSYEAYFYNGISLSPEYTMEKGIFTVPDTGSVSVFINYHNCKSYVTPPPFGCIVVPAPIDIFRIGTIIHPEGFDCVQNCGDCDSNFQLYSDEQKVNIECNTAYYAVDTIYNVDSVYKEPFFVPYTSASYIKTDSIVKIYDHIERIYKDESDVGLLYYSTNADSMAEGRYFIKKDNYYVLFFRVSFDINKLQTISEILSTATVRQ